MWTKDYARVKTAAVSAGKRFSYEKTRGVTVGLVVLGGYLMAIDLIRRVKAS